MSAIWINHASNIADMVNCNNEIQAHIYLEQLMLFPVEIQDKIIEEISDLSQCSSEAVAQIIQQYSLKVLP